MGRTLRLLVALLCGATLGLLPIAPSALPVASGATAPTSKSPVMGPNLLSASQLGAWYAGNHSAPSLPTIPGHTVTALAQIFIDQGRAQGVRGDIAFVQSVLETGWFTFPSGGQIRPTFNNFAGLYAYNNRRTGTTCADEKKYEPTLPSRCYASPADGIRAQIILLRGYADATTKIMNLSPRPPSDLIGAAPVWEDFGGSSGRAIWATAPDYGIRILQIYSEALVKFGARAECLPYSPAGQSQVSGHGYWVVTADGTVYSFGAAVSRGSMSGRFLAAPITGSESTPSGAGYWELGRDGGIFSFGDARFYGSTGAMHLNKPVNGMERTASGHGYWLVADDGGIFSYGDAPFYGSTGAIKLNKPIIGMERTPSGHGYWLVASDGGIFAYGDAHYYGSTGDRALPAPIVSMQRTPSGHGYWMLRADGGVYSFGDATRYGDVNGCASYGASKSLVVTPDAHGYWIATRSGSVIPLGDARKLGMPPALASPAVGLMLQS